MKRTLDDPRDGSTVEVEIDDTPPDERLTLEEYLQVMLLARQIVRGGVKPPPAPSAMPGHESRYGRKKGKR